MKVETEKWGYLKDGNPIVLIRLVNKSGAYVEFSNLGASWLSAYVPDSSGNFDDVILGCLTPEAYLNDNFYMGSTIGRFANRISNAQFILNNQLCKLENNDGINSNHGGCNGFHSKLWKYHIKNNTLTFSLTSPHGEGGYPGKLKVDVDYTWSDDNCLSITHKGKTDRPTYLNMTSHAYFNLAGHGSIKDHELLIGARQILETNQQYIPTGQFIDVINSPFDFTNSSKLGNGLFTNHQQIKWNNGYNHCYVLKTEKNNHLVSAAILSDPSSHRKLEVQTTLPGLILYTANFLKTNYPGKKYSKYLPHYGVCLETQFFPDTPNQPTFPSCLIDEKNDYWQETKYLFSTC